MCKLLLPPARCLPKMDTFSRVLGKTQVYHKFPGLRHFCLKRRSVVACRCRSRFSEFYSSQDVYRRKDLVATILWLGWEFGFRPAFLPPPLNVWPKKLSIKNRY